MKTIIKETESNIKTHLENERTSLYGIFMGDIPGGFCRINTSDRSYHVEYIIDEKIKRFFVDAYPQIVCEKPYRHMMHAYVNEKTSGYKSGRVDIDDDNGEVSVRVEASIVDKPVSAKDIKDMEHLAIHICDSIEKRLDKMAHGVYFKEDDSDLMSAAEKKFASLKKRLSALHDDEDSEDSFEDLMNMLESDDDDENSDVALADATDNTDDNDGTTEDNTEEVGDEPDESTDKSFDDLFPKDETDDDD